MQMDAVEVIRRLHEHRAWGNQKLLAACDRLSDEQLRQPLTIGQGSLWRSLLHLYAAEYVWLEALLGNAQPLLPGDLPGKLPGNQLGEGAIASYEELKGQWNLLAQRWANYLAALTADALDDLVYKTSTSSGAGRQHATRRADVLIHVCTHAHYTAAQTVNMLRRVDAPELPDLMLISLARQEAAQQTPSHPEAS